MKRIWIPQVIVALMLLCGLNPNNPYGYYILLRVVCCAGFVYLALKAFAQKKEGWTWVLGITAIVYNPILRIHLTREIWSVINLVTIGIAIGSIFILRANTEDGGERKRTEDARRSANAGDDGLCPTDETACVQQNATDTQKAEGTYEQLLEVAKHDPDSVDFTELRLAYARSPNYDPYNAKDDIVAAKKEFYEALEETDSERIINACNTLLGLNHLYISAHVNASLNYSKVGNEVKELYHQEFARKLLESICLSGDGRTPETGFVVVSIEEEYALLNRRGLQMEEQSLDVSRGIFSDTLVGRDPRTGETSQTYFTINLIVKGIQEGRAKRSS